MVIISCTLLYVAIWLHRTQGQAYILPCDDTIFCTGDILQKVQLSRAFADAKTFVDMPLKGNRSQIAPVLRAKLQGTKTKAEIREIVEEYCSREGTELRKVTPADWKPDSWVFAKIKDPEYVSFARMIHAVWKTLTREIVQDVQLDPSRYTLLYLRKPFVVPGGRFRELYYWDTYWVIKGLLLSNMTETVRGMLSNFVNLVKDYGKIPNGGRKYYLNRSQPPFLTLMVKEYYLATKDVAFVKEVFPYLEKEYDFWMRNRNISVQLPQTAKPYTLNMYSTSMGSPRPESYWQDVETLKESGIKDPNAQKELYSHIASAAESGWDFSSRWFNITASVKPTMTSIQTRKIIPVDLNSILFAVERALHDFANMVGKPTASASYKVAFEQRSQAIEAVFWDDEFGQWVDYDIETKSHRKVFYLSNIFPLWAGCHGLKTNHSQVVINSLKKLKILEYPAGIPTSLIHSDQQWDYPNAWPPLQEIAEEALRCTGSQEGKSLAFQLAKKWLETNYISWKQSGNMYEKYDVNIRGKPGHGGEYNVQVGFGWTNGVVLEFLARYGQELKAPPVSHSTITRAHEVLSLVTLTVIASLLK